MFLSLILVSSKINIQFPINPTWIGGEGQTDLSKHRSSQGSQTIGKCQHVFYTKRATACNFTVVYGPFGRSNQRFLGTGRPVVPLSQDKEIFLSRCPFVPEKMTRFPALERHFPVLEHPFLFQNVLFCFRASFFCFRTSFSALSRFVPRPVPVFGCPGPSRIFAPTLVPGQKDKNIFCPGTKGQRDVPSRGNTSQYI